MILSTYAIHTSIQSYIHPFNKSLVGEFYVPGPKFMIEKKLFKC